MFTSFGEIMLRILPASSAERLDQANVYRIEPGGSESNVAIALSNLGQKSMFVSRLPDNQLSNIVYEQLRKFSIDTSYIQTGGQRIGVYWTERGVGPRNSQVIYDRDNSAFSTSNFNDYNWAQILKKTTWFHFSGISPAVSRTASKTLERVIDICTCPYSVDLNYRSLLWKWVNSDHAKINDIMTNLCSKASLIAGNESDYYNIFRMSSNKNNEVDNYTELASSLFKKFRNTKYISISNRKSLSATNNIWNGYLFVNGDTQFCYKGIDYVLENIQDRVGTGDSFASGVIYGLINKAEYSYKEIIDFAVTLSALNHTTIGDASRFSVRDVKSVLRSKGSGRIVR
jgi:2-dehydro-3-deoxygluconokinase